MVESDSAPQQLTPPVRRPWWRLSARLLTILILAGAFLHLTLQDRVPYLATAWYVLPLPVLFGLSICRLVCARVLRRFAAVWGMVVLLLAGWTAYSTLRWHPPSTTPETIRVVCWNAGRNRREWRPACAEAINRLQPDIVTLVEAGGDLPALRRFFAEHCPDLEVSLLRTGLVCLTRGEAGQGSLFSLSGGGACGQLSVKVRGRDVELFVVDVHSTPLLYRAEPLSKLAEKANAVRERPAIVLGDFNTPHDSVHLESLRTHYRHAFETSGHGYIGTWPVPLPVLNLDQIWTNRLVHPEACQHVWTTLSDHRLVVADVAFVTPAQVTTSD